MNQPALGFLELVREALASEVFPIDLLPIGVSLDEPGKFAWV
jgi:hypothetical protein